MKKYITLSLVGLILCSGLTALASPLHEENTFEKATFVFSQPTILQQQDFVSVSLSETNSFLMHQGKPMLPSLVESFYFPFGTRINSVTVTPTTVNLQAVSRQIAPTPQMLTSNQRVANKEYILDYGTELYPSTWYEYDIGCGRFSNELQIVVTVEIYPVRYHPLHHTIEYASEAQVVIDYELNPTPMSFSDDFQFVVIGPSEFSSQIAPLITHKIARGLTTKFVSLTDIYSGTYFPATGRDNQEKIKYFIKNAIETWMTGSVLLVGGSSYVPVRETHVYIADDPQYGNEIFVSDLYYADIYNATGGFSCWDTNNNNIFGEYNWQGQTDQVDLRPDVYLSRLAATSGTQVTTAVNKIIGYENNPGYLQDWFTNLVGVGGDTFDDTNSIPEGEYSNQKVIDLMTGFIPNKIWATNGKLSGISPTGVANIRNAFVDGAGFVDMSGHGNTNIWATHPVGNHNIWIPTPTGGFKTSDALSLTNGNKLPIVTVEACSTAKFASDPNCFNWAFIANANGGAIGTFGATGIGYGYIGTGVTQGLIGKIGLDTYRAYKLDKATTFGEMWTRALNRYIKPNMNAADYKTVEEWTSFGDPTLIIAEQSQPPAKPATPSGPASGKVRVEYTYTSSTTDPEGNKIYYLFDWGDNTTSGWIGPLNSGAVVSATKSWATKGSYEIRVIAKDDHGVLSVWSDPLPISMPTETLFSPYPRLMNFLEAMMQRFPLAFPILRALLA